MPTGVPLADGREQLFEAARRVLLRDGGGALTSRAVTTEAGVAKGLLHRYFADFDAFLAALAVVELERIDACSTRLRAIAGEGTVADNLTAALRESLTPELMAIAALAVSRRWLLERLRLTTPTGIPLLTEVATTLGAYLTAERGLGRIAPETDVDRLALLLVGGGHLLGDAGEVRELVATALAGVDAEGGANPPARASRSPRRSRPDR
jgi:AcrR family transcriptional regulator